ncbi:DUF4328 domain-containing protein [Streptomyces sp. CB03238]|uniref:DUF4328 domain-containing protein n=1 Tax=Streptomyces sp. CB03238 TaxID=1907777 RepID=UPI000A0FB8CE|nr:DUF4328 domain-containing protein [Streptomyces sp. CB03238]ORT59818.1 hypothetical protein BKD26_11365 [Streptomyces sp. CB03238]
MNTASTGEGLCDACAVTAPAAGPRPAPPASVAPPPPAPAGAAGPFLRSPVGLGRAVVALLCVVIVVDLFAVFADVHMHRFARDVAAGHWEGPVSGAERADLLMAWAGRLQVLSLVATAVVFIVWLHRVRVNAAVFAPDVLTSGAGWAIGGWFVPVMNLWMPRRIARESWLASTHDPYGPPAKDQRATVLHVWWTLWLLTALLGRGAGMAYDKADTFHEIVGATQLLVVADAVSVAAALCAILVVRRLTAMQHAKAMRGPVPAVAEPMGSGHTQ